MILLIWDNCGEDEPKIYALSGASAELAISCDGHYVNSSNLPANSRIDELAEFLGLYSESNPTSYEIEKSLPCGPFDRVVICGFIP